MSTKIFKNAIPIDEDVVIVPYGATASQQEIEVFEKSLFEALFWWSSFLSQDDLQTLIKFVSNFVFFQDVKERLDPSKLIIVGEDAFFQKYFEHVGAYPDSLFVTLKNLFPSLPLITSDDSVDGFICINFVEPIIDAHIFDDDTIDEFIF
jgi:hypothetical protein